MGEAYDDDDDDDEDDDLVDRLMGDKAKRKPPQRPVPGPSAPRRATNGARVGGYAPKGLQNNIDNLRALAGTTGTRQTELNKACFSVGQLIQPGGLTWDVARSELVSAALYIGLTPSELKQWDLPDRGLRDGMSQPRDPAKVNGNGYGTAGYGAEAVLPPPPPKPPTPPSFYDVEDDFWNSRRSLQVIYASALSQMCAPWAVLACCAARALTTVRPCVTLPDLIGGPGSLNWFAAITASSGGGKGAASATAKRLVEQFVQQRNTGSGEGMIGAYVRPKDGDEPAGRHEALMFMVDEADSLTAQSARSGSQTMPVLRQAFSGETLGFSYVNKNTPTLDEHSYRMTLVVSVQPSRAAGLLGDAEGGTPQRFMWFPGRDERISVEAAGTFIEKLVLPKPGKWQYPRTIEIPSEARELIVSERVKAMQGRTDTLDGHALFVREKFAFALAVLDGRIAVTQEDWRLSGIAAKVSDLTRDSVQSAVVEGVDNEATERGRLQGISTVAATEEREYRTDQKRARMQSRIFGYVKAAGAQGIKNRDLTNKLKGAERVWLEPSLNALVASEVVRFDEAEKRWRACS